MVKSPLHYTSAKPAFPEAIMAKLDKILKERSSITDTFGNVQHTLQYNHSEMDTMKQTI